MVRRGDVLVVAVESDSVLGSDLLRLGRVLRLGRHPGRGRRGLRLLGELVAVERARVAVAGQPGGGGGPIEAGGLEAGGVLGVRRGDHGCNG
eukprot:scaffold678203_cov42-Prasinocladus_malaysianus.AAC.1